MSKFVFKGVEFRTIDKGGLKFRSAWGLEGSRLDITYRVPWKDRTLARQVLIGNTTFVRHPVLEVQGIGYLHRELPHAHDEGEGWMFCKLAEPDPEITLDPDDALPNAKYALIHAIYEGLPYESLEDTALPIIGMGGVPDESLLTRYVSLLPPRDTGRTLQAKGATWRFTGTTRTLKEATFLPTPGIEKVYCWHQVPWANIPWNAIAGVKGTTNGEAFDGMAAGRAIMKDWSLETIRLPSGTRAANLIYKVEDTFVGANYFPDPDRGWAFHPVEAADGSGRAPYMSGDFNSLFRPVIPA